MPRNVEHLPNPHGIFGPFETNPLQMPASYVQGKSEDESLTAGAGNGEQRSQ